MSSSDRLALAAADCPCRRGRRAAPRASTAAASRRAFVRFLGAAPLAWGLAACGFRLRGDVSYVFTSLYVNAPAATPLAAELTRTLAGGSVRLAEDANGAEVILDVANVADDKTVLSLSSGGRVREYLLTKRATVALHDANGRDWLPASEIVVRRSFTFNESEVLAREAQETRLLREMQTDVVQQIVRRLQAATKPG